MHLGAFVRRWRETTDVAYTCYSMGDGEWKEDAAKGALECEAIPRFCEGNPVDESGYGQNIVMTDKLDECDRAMGTICASHCAGGTAQLPGTDLEYKCAADGTRTDHGKWAATTATTC